MPSGGRRNGAGRPKGQGKYREPTKPIRVPESMIDEILKFVNHNGYKLPFYDHAVSAGFPSPADDDVSTTLDLNEHLIQNPAATYFVRVSGDSMINAGIHQDDILVVDRSLPATNGKVVIAAVDGQLTVKRLRHEHNAILLIAENENYPPIHVSQESDLMIWGVVTNVIHHV